MDSNIELNIPRKEIAEYKVIRKKYLINGLLFSALLGIILIAISGSQSLIFLWKSSIVVLIMCFINLILFKYIVKAFVRLLVGIISFSVFSYQFFGGSFYALKNVTQNAELNSFLVIAFIGLLSGFIYDRLMFLKIKAIKINRREIDVYQEVKRNILWRYPVGTIAKIGLFLGAPSAYAFGLAITFPFQMNLIASGFSRGDVNLLMAALWLSVGGFVFSLVTGNCISRLFFVLRWEYSTGEQLHTELIDFHKRVDEINRNRKVAGLKTITLREVLRKGI